MERLIIVEKGKTWAMRFGKGVYPQENRFRNREKRLGLEP